MSAPNAYTNTLFIVRLWIKLKFFNRNCFPHIAYYISYVSRMGRFREEQKIIAMIYFCEDVSLKSSTYSAIAALIEQVILKECFIENRGHHDCIQHEFVIVMRSPSAWNWFALCLPIKYNLIAFTCVCKKRDSPKRTPKNNRKKWRWGKMFQFLCFSRNFHSTFA